MLVRKLLPRTSAALYDDTKQASSPNNLLSRIETAVGGTRDVLLEGESNFENPDIAETSRHGQAAVTKTNQPFKYLA